jgi:hypothetical protein
VAEPKDSFGLGSSLEEDLSGEPDTEDEGEDVAAVGKQAAADDVMTAMKSGDKAGFATALEAFVHLCYPED